VDVVQGSGGLAQTIAAGGYLAVANAAGGLDEADLTINLSSGNSAIITVTIAAS
jgi:hypothetical protein